MANEMIRTRNKEKVIETTARLLVEIGFERTTIRRIAEESGVSTRSVMNYFPTKNDIIREALSRILSRIYASFGEYLQTKDYQSLSGCEQFIALERFILVYSSDHFYMVKRIREVELGVFGESDLFSEMYDRIPSGNSIASAIKRAIAKGLADSSIRPDFPCDQESLVMLSYALTGLFHRIASIRSNPELERRFRTDRMIISFLSITQIAAENKA